MKKQNKERVNVEAILVYLLIGIFFINLLSILFSKLDRNISDYSRMREKGVEERRNTVITPDDSIVDFSPTQIQTEEPLTQAQQLLEKADLPITTKVNWTLVEAIAALTEHEVGWSPEYFEGYDFDEIQQVMAKSVLNRLSSNKFPNDFYNLVNQDGQYPDMWEYICTHHYRVKETTLVNVLKVFYKNGDYAIPKDLYFEHSFPYNEDLEEATDTGEATPAVGSPYQAAEWLATQNISTGIYSYSSYIYDEGNGVKRLLIFSCSSTGPY